MNLTNGTFFNLIFNFVSHHKRGYVTAVILLLAYSALSVWIPTHIGHMVDELAKRDLSHDEFVTEMSFLLGLCITNYFLDYGWNTQIALAARQMGMFLRTELFKRLSLQGPEFFQRQSSGDLLALGSNDADSIQHAAGEAMVLGLSGAFTFVMVLVMMFLDVDWLLTSLILIPFLFMAYAFHRVIRQIHDAAHDELTSFSQLNSLTLETVAGIRTVRALGLESVNATQFSELATRAADSAYRFRQLQVAFSPIIGLTVAVTLLLALSYGGYHVWSGKITIGMLTSFTIYMGMLLGPMFSVGMVIKLIESGRAAWGRLEPVLNMPLSIQDHGTISDAPTGSVQFKDVSFIYPDHDVEALHGINLTLEPGKTVGVVGPTGSGKSTLIRLLLRQYEPTRGCVQWGDHGLSDFPIETVREHQGWVAQEPFLFSATIAQNIALSKPAATQGEIEQAAKLAAIHEDILRFPNGYNTEVGERGVTLSGGQRQRVAIARALLIFTPLLLLDDSLSAVDTGTQASILKHLRSARADMERSVLIVSHRLSSVADADQIVVMNHGKIVEQGTHVELLARDGWYAAEWHHQELEDALLKEATKEDSYE